LPAPMDPVRPMCFGGMPKGRANREFVEKHPWILQELPWSLLRFHPPSLHESHGILLPRIGHHRR